MAPEDIVEAPNGKILVTLHFHARGAEAASRWSSTTGR